MASSASSSHELANPATPVAQTSKLLSLPAELLDMIFKEFSAYRPRGWESPICRALLHFYDDYREEVNGRFRNICIVGSDELSSYCRSLEIRTRVGARCKSFQVERKDANAVLATDSDALLLFSSLTNVTTLKLVDDQLVGSFLELAATSQPPFMPHLADLVLDAHLLAHRDPFHPSCLKGLAAFPALNKLTLELSVADDRKKLNEVRCEDEYSLDVEDLTLVDSSARPGAADLIDRCSSLRRLHIIDTADALGNPRLLEAAANLNTVTELCLDANSEGSSWKLPKVLKTMSTLTRLSVGPGCTCGDKPSFELLRRLPLRHLEFCSGTLVSAAHLVDLVSGEYAHPSLEVIYPNNRSEIEDWLDGGYHLPTWTKTFSRAGLEDVINAAEDSGVKVRGIARKVLQCEDNIRELKELIEQEKAAAQIEQEEKKRRLAKIKQEEKKRWRHFQA